MKNIKKSKNQKKHWKKPKPWTPKVALRPSGVLLVSWLIIFFAPCHVIKPSGSRTSLRDQCFFCLGHILCSFVTRSALVPLEKVAVPKTVVTFLLLRHYKTSDIWITHWSSVLFTRASSSTFVEPESNTLITSHDCNTHILVKLYRSQLISKFVIFFPEW